MDSANNHHIPEKHRDQYIAERIYKDNATYDTVGLEVGLKRCRTYQVYQRVCRLALKYRETGINPHQHLDLDMFNEEFVSIDEDVARYNIDVKTNARIMTGWIHLPEFDTKSWDGTFIRPYRSRLHLVTMVRLIMEPGRPKRWECNKHFFTKCIENPDWQIGKNGIFTKIPVNKAIPELMKMR